MPKRKDFALAGAGLVGAGVAAWRTMFPWIGDDIKTLRVLSKAYKRVFENINNERYIIDMFEEHAKKSPQKAFLIFEDRIYTYEFIDRMANRVANLAMTWNLPVGDTVAIMIDNEPAFIWTFLGTKISHFFKNIDKKKNKIYRVLYKIHRPVCATFVDITSIYFYRVSLSLWMIIARHQSSGCILNI